MSDINSDSSLGEFNIMRVVEIVRKKKEPYPKLFKGQPGMCYLCREDVVECVQATYLAGGDKKLGFRICAPCVGRIRDVLWGK